MAKITPITPAAPIGLPERGPILSEVVGDGTLELVDMGMKYGRLVDVMLRVIGVEEVIVLLLVRDCAILLKSRYWQMHQTAARRRRGLCCSRNVRSRAMAVFLSKRHFRYHHRNLRHMTDPLSPTCRILVVASELPLALNLVNSEHLVALTC